MIGLADLGWDCTHTLMLVLSKICVSCTTIKRLERCLEALPSSEYTYRVLLDYLS